MNLYANENNDSGANWESLCPLIEDEAQNGKKGASIFKLVLKGVETKTDNWLYDFSVEALERKLDYLLTNNAEIKQDVPSQNTIQLNSALDNHLNSDLIKEFKKYNILPAAFRPFFKQYLYFDEYFIRQPDQWLEIIQKKSSYPFIAIKSPGNYQEFFCLSADIVCDIHFTGNSRCLPLYCYSNGDTWQYNITDWALHLFNDHYRQNEPASPVCYAGSSELRDEFRLDIPVANPITKESIFHYVYAVLHYPAYRKKYRLNLKREFPRIPLYDNFQQWAAWGKRLMELHIYYEAATPYPLERRDVVIEPKAGVKSDSLHKPILKAHKEEGEMVIDANTTLSRIPKTAWDYRLGNRSALEWIVDQYKEKKPYDPTISELFNTYRFSDYKEQVIDLLKRVCTVSVETMEIIGEMKE